MLHLAIFLMLQQAAVPVPPAVATPPAAVAPATAPPSPATAPMAPANELLQVKNVYILPMGSSLDQYLANRLTRGGVLQVVIDPAKADAILTDRIGKALEVKLEELYPDPVKKAAAEALLQKAKDEETDENYTMQIRTNPVERGGSMGRAKGTLFLVHRGSRNVIWSVYELPKSTRPDDLDEVATAAVNKLGSAIGKSAKSGATASAPAEKKKGWWPW